MPERQKPSLEEIARVVRDVVEREMRRESIPVNPEREPSKLSKATLITHEDVLRCAKQKRPLVLPKRYMMTPLAKDALDKHGVKTVEYVENDDRSREEMKKPTGALAIWADRYSHHLKNAILEKYTGAVTFHDFSADPNLECLIGTLQNDASIRGIVISETGAELGILLNKHPGIRAVFAESAEPVASTREKVSANLLVLSSQQTSIHNAIRCVDAFLHTEFANPRYKELIEEILKAERKN